MLECLSLEKTIAKLSLHLWFPFFNFKCSLLSFPGGRTANGTKTREVLCSSCSRGREVTNIWCLTLTLNNTKTLFTWSGGPRSSGVSFFCFVSPRAWKQKKPTPQDRGSKTIERMTCHCFLATNQERPYEQLLHNSKKEFEESQFLFLKCFRSASLQINWNKRKRLQLPQNGLCFIYRNLK